MNILWTKKAIDGWQEVADYILAEFGKDAFLSFEQRTNEAEKTIALMPNIGSIEWSDTTNKVVFRYITINKRSKILYYIGNDVIYIVDFWDVRKNKPA